MLEARLVLPTDGFSIRCCWWLVTGDTRQLTPDPGPVTTDGDRAAPSHHRDTKTPSLGTPANITSVAGGWVQWVVGYFAKTVSYQMQVVVLCFAPC